MKKLSLAILFLFYFPFPCTFLSGFYDLTSKKPIKTVALKRNRNFFLSYLFSFFLLFQYNLQAQNPSISEWLFSTQEQIDLFPSQHPGLTVLDGDLTIKGDQIVNLDSLIQICEINGNLLFSNCSNLNSFIGLNNLRVVQGDFDIIESHLIENFQGLNSLTSILGDFNFRNSHSFKNFQGLEKLKQVEQSMYVDNMLELKDFRGLNSLSIVGNLFVFDNPRIKNFSGLDSLYQVGQFKIGNNDSLINLIGLNRIWSAKYLKIYENDRLVNFNGIQSLSNIEKDFYIKDNNSLKSFYGINSLGFIGSDLYIMNNDSLVSIEALENTYITNYLSIKYNPMLSDCAISGICEFITQNQDVSYSFYRNALGCNSKHEVDSLCGTPEEYKYNVLPFYEIYGDKPDWTILVHKKHQYPNYGITLQYYYDDKIDMCYREYSVLRFPNSVRKVYVRSDYQKAWYRYTEDCNDKEYLLYDYTLSYGEKVWLGWEDDSMEKDTAQFVVSDISIVEYFGIPRKQIVLEYAENDGAYTGRLTWVNGIGSLEHPFYPFAKMNDHFMRENELLCLQITDEQYYQNPNYTTCDTSYTAVDELETDSFRISPNPFNDQIRLELNGEKILDIKIYNISGRKIPITWTQNTQFAQIQVLEEAFYGLCFLQITEENGFKNYKLLRQK